MDSRFRGNDSDEVFRKPLCLEYSVFVQCIVILLKGIEQKLIDVEDIADSPNTLMLLIGLHIRLWVARVWRGYF